MTRPLQELAESAEENARDQQRIARKARRLDREREKGTAWSTILDRDRRPGLLELLAASARRVATMTNDFRRAVAGALSKEGSSTRQIARRFGVSHQRISAMLRGDGR